MKRRYKIWPLGVMWFVDENEAVNRIPEIVCGDEIAFAHSVSRRT